VGTWYLSLAASLFLVLIGLYIHWSVVAVGLLLPFIPMLSYLLMRRARRKREAQADKGSPRL
jgi:Zn-dependent protease with chaperone function